MKSNLRNSPSVGLRGLALALGFVASGAAGAADYQRFAESLEAYGWDCDPAPLNEVFDLEAVATRSLDGLNPSDEIRQGLVKGLSSSLRLGTELCRELEPDGRFVLRRVATSDGATRALFRAEMADDNGVNYYWLRLEAGEDGRVFATDTLNYLSGEWLSAQLRRWYLHLAGGTPGLLERLTGKENLYFENLEEILQVTGALQAREWQRALAAIEALPGAVQRERTMLVARLRAASELDDDNLYRAAMRAIEEAYPGDPSFALALVDRYFLDEDYLGARRLMHRVEDSLGGEGDAYMAYLIAVSYTQEDQFDRAEVEFRRALKLEPDFELPYWNLVTLFLDREDYAATAEILDAVQRDAGVELVDLTTLDDYAGFVASPEYAVWLKRQPATPRASP